MDKDFGILLADDSMVMRQTVKSVLASEGYFNVQVASTGVDALAKIRESIANKAPFKLIFMDWNMPGMDGLSLLKLCRGDLGLKDTAIIMLTAVSDQQSVISVMKAGANAYLIKPVSADMIISKLEQVTAWMETNKEKA